MAKILIVDDEPSIVNLVAAYLKLDGCEALIAMDGIELLSRLRRESGIYLILLTAKTEETDKIVGFSVGAGSGSETGVLSFRHLHMDAPSPSIKTRLCSLPLSLIF